MKNYDVIVVGLGIMGSSACLELARRGIKVLGIEQFSKAHALGSSHGEVRMIRQAYFEHPDYVPLLKSAYTRWNELCDLAESKLFHQRGLLMVGPVDGGQALDHALKSAALHGIVVEKINGKQIGQRFSGFANTEGMRGVFEPGGGYLNVEESVAAYCDLSLKNGATLNFNERVLNWRASTGHVEVKTDKGIYRARQLIFAAGPWSQKILSGLDVPLSVQRATQFWFEPKASQASAFSSSPCFAFDMPYGFVYGFPDLGQGVKIADHRAPNRVQDAYVVDRKLYEEDSLNVRKCIGDFLPGLNLTPARGSVCLYTMTPDENFIIDNHPEHDNVAFAAGFSGHGFKFASIVGPILADLATERRTKHPIDFLRLRWS